jgi:hypothetical protein
MDHLLVILRGVEHRGQYVVLNSGGPSSSLGFVSGRIIF